MGLLSCSNKIPIFIHFHLFDQRQIAIHGHSVGALCLQVRFTNDAGQQLSADYLSTMLFDTAIFIWSLNYLLAGQVLKRTDWTGTRLNYRRRRPNKFIHINLRCCTHSFCKNRRTVAEVLIKIDWFASLLIASWQYDDIEQFARDYVMAATWRI